MIVVELVGGATAGTLTVGLVKIWPPPKRQEKPQTMTTVPKSDGNGLEGSSEDGSGHKSIH